MFERFRSALLGGGNAKKVASALAERMGVSARQAGAAWRARGPWDGVRCQLELDEQADSMSVEATSAVGSARLEITDPNDSEVLGRLAMKLRLHTIEVIEAGRGRLRVAEGRVCLEISRAGLARPDAVAQATIRMDVVAELAQALPGALQSVDSEAQP